MTSRLVRSTLPHIKHSSRQTLYNRSSTNTHSARLHTSLKPSTTLSIPRQMSTTTTDAAGAASATSHLPHAQLTLRGSADRGHADHGWLNTYHTFSFASYQDPEHQDFGSLRVLNEDRVGPQSGFPFHRHRDFEIFSYILTGELTHRDSMHGLKADPNTASSDDYFVMKRGDIQFTTGGTGIAHSETNENKDKTVHFLQIWVKPWATGLPPTYHTATFSNADKRQGFVRVISPLAAGRGATAEQEKAARPKLDGTIPIHADFVMGAGIIAPGKTFEWSVGSDEGIVTKKNGRNVYIHLPMTKAGQASVKVNGVKTLREGDGVFMTKVNAGDVFSVESTGSEEAEVVILDSD